MIAALPGIPESLVGGLASFLAPCTLPLIPAWMALVLGSGPLGQPSLGIRTDLPFKEAKGQLVEMFEREYIEDLMRRHKMNLSAAAREAQIDRKHLRELMHKYGLDARHHLVRDEQVQD